VTANDDLLDDAIRRAVALRRFTDGEARRAIEVLSGDDRALADWLRGRLAGLTRSRRLDTAQFREFVSAFKGKRAAAFAGMTDSVRAALRELVKLEAQAELSSIDDALPVSVELASVSVAKLYAAAFDRPFAEGAPLADWFRRLAADDQARLTRAVQLGIVQGEPVPQIVGRVVGTRARGFADGALAISRRNAETVVRTAVNHVSNAAREAVWSENADMFRYLRWVSTLDGRTSKICAWRDGALTSVGGAPLPPGAEKLDPLNARPPAHPNCLPGNALVLPIGSVAGATKRWYEGKVVVFRTAAGHEVTSTPNHPVLTDRGWVPAKRLNQDDRVVCYTGTQNPLARAEAEHEQRPASIEEVARSVLERGPVSIGTSSTRDFHGDGVNGEVYVVGTDRALACVEDQTTFASHILKQTLERRRVASLSRESASAEFVMGGDPTPHGSVSRTHLGGALRLRSTFPDDPIGFRHGSTNVPVLQQFDDRGDATPETLGDVLGALAGQVALDDVVLVRESDFCGHVYNLETSVGFYAVSKGNIITHNCRSTMVAVVDADAYANMVGERPFVRDSRTRVERERDFRAEARDRAGGRWAGMDAQARNAAVRRVRQAWARETVGQVPARVTYSEWLRRQPAAFQDEVLGKARGALFRKGGVQLGQFVDRSGREFNLDELRDQYARQFRRANL
jgi:hypothetical protein